ncbi:MAG: hypothetical protein GY755_11530 [Chloroflexi bacterium]|nr:hypothetical protein [Chloroflexota bacterium]
MGAFRRNSAELPAQVAGSAERDEIQMILTNNYQCRRRRRRRRSSSSSRRCRRRRHAFFFT